MVPAATVDSSTTLLAFRSICTVDNDTLSGESIAGSVWSRELP